MFIVYEYAFSVLTVLIGAMLLFTMVAMFLALSAGIVRFGAAPLQRVASRTMQFRRKRMAAKFAARSVGSPLT